MGQEGGNSDRADNTQTEVESEVMVINQVKSTSLYHITIQVADTLVDAVIDTAAESTILSEQVFQTLQPRPPTLCKMKFLTTGRDMSMSGQKGGPVDLKVRSMSSKEILLHVAPIEDDMLLGFDFLVRKGVKLDMKNHLLTIGESTIPLRVGNLDSTPRVCRVTVAKRRVIPPNSVARVKCHLNKPLPDYFIEADENPKLMIPRTVHLSGDQPHICVVNVTDNFMVMKKGQTVGAAIETDILTDVSPEWGGTAKEGPKAATCSLEKEDILEHLIDMLEASKGNLSEEECSKLTEVICSFPDAFASHVYDLGSFREIEHKIDTRDTSPIKQRMRRTPIHFAKEEEGELNKMLEAGVIEPSVSEWASAPVLVRKRDGSVRFVIDYRALNNITVKDVYPLPLVEDCVDTLSENRWFSK
ncbi:uncharacterized protein LOC110452235 [Mizuhopecten yessoensis]|uniref:uncharacterized protein LOC110452235 n=1 Tax=Mizuhopecten yessoensis TaxID=6573 RepID=UPI000B45BB9C|nr:uncharacterized protein LOC110452235 [Mizuhopecten yessoensis]